MSDFIAVDSGSLLGNSLLSWLIALGVILVLFFVLLTARSGVRRYHARLRQTNSTELTEIPIEILSRTTLLFFIVVSVFAGLSTLSMPERVQRVLDAGLMLTLFFQAGIWVSAAAMAWLERRRRRTATVTDRAVAGSLGIIAFILRVAIWSLVLLVALANIIRNNAAQNEATVVPEAAPTVAEQPAAEAVSDPLAEAGVVPEMPTEQSSEGNAPPPQP